MKRFAIFLMIFFSILILSRVTFAQTPSVAPAVTSNESRYAACDLCGYCPPHPAPERWASCKKCLYPGIPDDPLTNESLKIDPVSNAAPTIVPGKQYTYLGCLGNGKSFTDESASSSVVQSILNTIFSAIGGIAFLYLLYGSFIISTSQTEPEKLNYGKRIIYGAIVGLLFSLFSILIVKTISNNILKIPNSNLLMANSYGNATGEVNYVQPDIDVATITPTLTITPFQQIIITDPSPTIEPIITDVPIPTSTIKPTNMPKPTATPRPTQTPTPPPITSNLRPGTSLSAIFDEVSKRVCIPAALLQAFQTLETGAFFNKNYSPSVIKIYNTYDWWKNGNANPCTGIGYHAATGIVPSDSVGSGTRCTNGNGDAVDEATMGILQLNTFEQETTRRLTLMALPNNIDRRVLFDNALIFAYATKNRIGTSPKSCTDWPDDVIKLAAQKHYGSCYISSTRDYCKEILTYYKQYK